MQKLKLESGEMYYQMHGQGSPLVLLHAGVADSRMWDDSFTELAKDFTVISCDLRGYGQSLLPNAAFAYHQDVLALIKHLGLSSCYLLGCSFGAKVAIDTALSSPSLIKGLILVSPVVGGFEPKHEVKTFGEQEDQLLEAGLLEQATELNLTMWVDGPHRSPEQVDATVREKVGRMQLDAFQQPEPELAELIKLNPPAIERLTDITCPSLILSGALDVPEFLTLAETLSAKIPNAERLVINNTAHMLSMEKPEEFCSRVRKFIQV